MMYHLHDGFIDKNSYEYEHAKFSAKMHLWTGMLFLIAGVFGVIAAVACNTNIWWNVALGLFFYMPISYLFLKRYFVDKRNCYGLQRGI